MASSFYSKRSRIIIFLHLISRVIRMVVIGLGEQVVVLFAQRHAHVITQKRIAWLTLTTIAHGLGLATIARYVSIPQSLAYRFSRTMVNMQESHIINGLFAVSPTLGLPNIISLNRQSNRLQLVHLRKLHLLALSRRAQ